MASENSDWFASQGIALGSTARWAEGNTCYAQGWAFGTLKFFPGDRIADAYQSGLLEPGDILLTDGVPAEVPFVAGIISLVPSTPNSHVAILARTYESPFVYLALADDAQFAQELVGHRILLTAYDKEDGTSEVKLIDTDALLDDDTAMQIRQLKKPSALQISPMASRGLFGVSTEGLSPSDIQYVGGKAANFGMLRRAVPENSPKAIALTFDLWNAFLDQPLTSTRTHQPGPRRIHAVLGRWRHRTGSDAYEFPIEQRWRMARPVRHRRRHTARFGRVRAAEKRRLLRPVRGRRRRLAILRIAHARAPNSAQDDPNAYRLVINEIMADNKRTIQDPCENDEYPDWIELYNASQDTIVPQRHVPDRRPE